MDHDRRFAGWTNQVYNVPEDQVTDYRSHTLIIMDDIARDANGQPVDQGEGSADAQHASKCQAIYLLFRDRFTNCQIRSARMPRNHDERYLLNFMEQELSQKTRRDVVTIYFNGKAGGDGKEYTWILRGPGPRQVNAHKLISKLNESEADLLFIIDAYFPTRLRKPWKRKDRMTEFMIAGPQHRDTDGRVLDGSTSYTESLCRSLGRMAEKPFGMIRMTIPLIIGMDKGKGKNNNAAWLPSKPLRVWVQRPNRTKPTRVWRLIIDKERTKRTNRLEFRACEVTGNRSPPGRVKRGGAGNAGGGGGGNGGGGGGGGDADSDSDSDSSDRGEDEDRGGNGDTGGEDDDEGNGGGNENDDGDDNNGDLNGNGDDETASPASRSSGSGLFVSEDDGDENRNSESNEQDYRSRLASPTPRMSPPPSPVGSPEKRIKRSRSSSASPQTTRIKQDLNGFKQRFPHWADSPELEMTAAYSLHDTMDLIEDGDDHPDEIPDEIPDVLNVHDTPANADPSASTPGVKEERESSVPIKSEALDTGAWSGGMYVD